MTRSTNGMKQPLTSELLDDRLENCSILLKQLQGFLLILPHQGCIAHQVGEHDSGELAFRVTHGYNCATLNTLRRRSSPADSGGVPPSAGGSVMKFERGVMG